MCRIIKFRVWDDKNKTMFNYAEFHIESDATILWGHKGFANGFLPVEYAIPMQFTGLLDKNGKEIYEGDIVVAYSEGYKGVFQIKWRQQGSPCYILYPAYQNKQQWHLHGSQLDNNKGFYSDSGVEIIGNIYENPELLEDKISGTKCSECGKTITEEYPKYYLSQPEEGFEEKDRVCKECHTDYLERNKCEVCHKIECECEDY